MLIKRNNMATVFDMLIKRNNMATVFDMLIKYTVFPHGHSICL